MNPTTKEEVSKVVKDILFMNFYAMLVSYTIALMFKLAISPIQILIMGLLSSFLSLEYVKHQYVKRDIKDVFLC